MQIPLALWSLTVFKLIPRLKPNYSFTDWLAMCNIFKKNTIITYEKKFAKKFENQYGVMFSHGRTALYALFKIWGLHNDEIICPAYTCVVVPNAIVLSGNIPVFVDCAQTSFNMSLDKLASAITEKTRAIIVTHLFGYPMDVEKIQEIVRAAELQYDHKIYVIQDVAHSYGAKWKGHLVTTFGDASIFGCNISKMINSIFGGMLLTNNSADYELLLAWRNDNLTRKPIVKSLKRFCYFVATNICFNTYCYSIVNWLERQGFLDKFVKYYEEDKIDFPNDWNYYPANIEARIGISQLNKYENIVKTHITAARAWQLLLKDHNITFMAEQEFCTYSHCVGLVENRQAWIEHFRKQGIQLGILIEYAIPYMTAYEKYKIHEYPNSLYYSEHTVNFPVWSKKICQ